MRGLFITGTDTGAGKTYLATRIARQLQRSNINVIPRKPVESGCRKQGAALIPEDALALKQAANYPGPLTEICPYRFEPAISPARAARLSNTKITIDQLVNACQVENNDDFTLVEGAGGFYSPLAEDGLNVDLAAALQLPVLLIAGNRLGAINQVLLTVEAIQSRGLRLLAVVLNAVENNSNAQMDNAADLRELLAAPVFFTPFNADNSEQLPDDLIKLIINTNKM